MYFYFIFILCKPHVTPTFRNIAVSKKKNTEFAATLTTNKGKHTKIVS